MPGSWDQSREYVLRPGVILFLRAENEDMLLKLVNQAVSGHFKFRKDLFPQARQSLILPRKYIDTL